MKLQHPIDIDLLRFFLTGKFDCIVPGQDAEWIAAHFADPDDDSDMGRGFRIQRWGSIEFHFEHNKLYLCRFSRAWDRWFLTSFPPFATG
jgi:hypothetical protein